MSSPLGGLIAAAYTPFHADGSLKLEMLPQYARFLRDNQVETAFVGGTTGEFASLTVAERKQLAEAWSRAAVGAGLRVAIHVGATALGDAQEMARNAAAAGVSAIACMAPGFFRPASVAVLVEWCALVAQSAPRLPFYYYHMPSMNGVDLPVQDFLAQAVGRIPNLAGVKYSHENLDDFAACAKNWGGRLQMLMGKDELLLDGLERGARGAVGTTYNYAAPLYRQIIAAFQGGVATGRPLQQRSIAMIAACCNVGVSHLAATKPLMAMLGVDCGPVRLPLINPTPVQVGALRSQLDADGFLDFSCRPLKEAA